MKKVLLISILFSIISSCSSPLNKKYNGNSYIADMEEFKTKIDSTDWHDMKEHITLYVKYNFEAELRGKTYAKILKTMKKKKKEQRLASEKVREQIENALSPSEVPDFPIKETEKLFNAIESHELENALVLVKNIEDANYEKKEKSLLMLASLNGYTELCEALINKKANLNFQSNDGNTALMEASFKGYTKVCEILIDNGAKLDLHNVDGATALMLASSNGFTEIVELLLDNDAKIDLQSIDGRTALIAASMSGHAEVVKILLDKGAAMELQHDNATALYSASMMGYTEVVKLLLDKGANIDFQDNNGISVLLIAYVSDKSEVYKLLLDNDVNIDLRDNEGLNILMYVSAQGDIKLVELLLNKGADPNIKCKKGKTAYDYAKNAQIKAVLKLNMKE